MDRKTIIKLAKKDFEKAWIESGKLVKKPHPDEKYPKLKYEMGQSHVLFDTIAQLREAYIRLGFMEVVNPLFIDKSHVHKQFGKEAPAVLDRCFYLAGLPRPDIGISIDKIQEIEKIGIDMDEDKNNSLQDVFRGYKKGTVDGDDLVLEVANALDTSNDLGLKVLEKVFPELYQLEPIPQTTTLRSHMTSGWFISLSEACKHPNLPIKMFSIDRCFRREQKEDSSHLMTYHSASCVICDDEVTLDTGMATSEALLRHFGFSNFKFIPDDKKSKYYTPETQTEVYGYHPKLNSWVEIATFGLYSPIALSKYGIDQQVMNLGCGVERIAMVLNGFNDIREMVYPQIYKKWTLSDRDLVSKLTYNYYPVTEEGIKLMYKISDCWKNNSEAKSPCNFEIFNGEFLNSEIELKAIEEEENTKLLGPASKNHLYVFNGNIFGIPENFEIENQSENSDEKLSETYLNNLEKEYKENNNTEILNKAVNYGIPTQIKYYESLAAKTAFKIEEAIISGQEELTLRNTIARSLSDVNLKIDDSAMRYINNENKIIDIRGPIFSTIKMIVK